MPRCRRLARDCAATCTNGLAEARRVTIPQFHGNLAWQPWLVAKLKGLVPRSVPPPLFVHANSAPKSARLRKCAAALPGDFQAPFFAAGVVTQHCVTLLHLHHQPWPAPRNFCSWVRWISTLQLGKMPCALVIEIGGHSHTSFGGQCPGTSVLQCFGTPSRQSRTQTVWLRVPFVSEHEAHDGDEDNKK